MTPTELSAFSRDLGARMKGVMVDYVAKALTPVLARVVALEQRAAEPGPAGAQGPQGAPGAQGERGEAGPSGEAGARGEKGDPGEPGQRGEPGASGERGPSGPEGHGGRDGRDGQPGAPGAQGEKGLDGRDGVNGRDGADGLGFDDIEVEHDGERGFTLKFVRGDRVKTFGAFTVPAMIHRGLWNGETAYGYQDVVTSAGAQWVCMKPKAAGKPGDPNTGWLLVVKRGDKGSPGPAGPSGPRGEKGDRGPDRF